VQPKARIPAVVTFVDIAGLVQGASEGEGLGNQFLANIRDVDAIVHVVRCFEDPDVTHVMGAVDSVRDREVINLELGLSDLQIVEKRLERLAKGSRNPEKDREQALLERLRDVLSVGKPARFVEPVNVEEQRLLAGYNLLTAKPELYAANIAEADLAAGTNAQVERLRTAVEAEHEPAEIVPLSARIEAELIHLEPGERAEFLEHLGLEEPGLNRLIRAGYHLLDLISYFTAGEKEVRAWTIRRGARAPQAAGEIHSDFERGFIRAETLEWEDFEETGSMKAARERGLIRSEGKEYEVANGDIILFRFNV
jgi:ribosome-binding ATPase